MSYSISFKVKVEGVNRYIEVGEGGTNITWNVRDIITKSTGLEWKNGQNNGLCSDVVKRIKEGLFELQINYNSYIKYESPNGWGTVRGTIRFFKEIIEAWDDLIAEDEELAKIATFWIE